MQITLTIMHFPDRIAQLPQNKNSQRCSSHHQLHKLRKDPNALLRPQKQHRQMNPFRPNESNGPKHKRKKKKVKTPHAKVDLCYYNDDA
jgi:hypothetical protein